MSNITEPKFLFNNGNEAIIDCGDREIVINRFHWSLGYEGFTAAEKLKTPVNSDGENFYFPVHPKIIKSLSEHFLSIAQAFQKVVEYYNIEMKRQADYQAKKAEKQKGDANA